MVINHYNRVHKQQQTARRAKESEMSKVTELKRINHLVIFGRSKTNRTYTIRTEIQLRRLEQLVGNLLINNNARAMPGSNGQYFSLVISKNIQQA